ncbi:MAG: hypothetical protein WCN88_00125 [Candidatus Falkowbacteria bacterium]
MKKNIVLPMLLGALIFIVSGCGAKKVNLEPMVDPSVTQEVVPSVKTVETKAEATKTAVSAAGETDKMVSCGSDRTCFMNQFLECLPSEFKIITGDGEKQLNIIGLAGSHCYFQGGLYKDGLLIGSGISCSMPKNLITNDVFNHFFGQDTALGKEDIKSEQDRIQDEYCNAI